MGCGQSPRWVDTDSGRKINMIARPVVGGFFLRFLQDDAVWRRWFERGQHTAKTWAPLPLAAVTTLAPCALDGEVAWRFTLAPPAEGWQQDDFDDRAWSTGRAGFGTKGTPGAVIGTEWSAADIWLRRTFALASTPPSTTHLLVHHDEDAEIWLNGLLAAKLASYPRGYERVAIAPRALAALRRGDNMIAVHSHQTTGGQFLDVGLVDAVMPR